MNPHCPAATATARAEASGTTVTLLAACLSTAAIAMTITASSVALASIQADLTVGLTQLQWILNAFVGSFALLLLPVGVMCDRKGPRPLFLAGVLIFGISGALSVIAPSYELLIAARLFQGVGAAFITASAPAAVTRAFLQDRARKRAFGYLGASGGIGLTLGALLAGTLIGVGGWRTALALPLPLMILAGVLVLATRDAMTRGPVVGRTGHFLDLLRHRRFALAVVMCLLFTTVWVALFIYAPLHMQSAEGRSAQDVATRMLALMVPALVMPLIATRLAQRFAVETVLAAGFIALAAGLCLLVLAWSSAGWAEPCGLALAGAGAGVLYGLVDYVALSAIPPAEAGAAAGMFNTFRLLGDVLAALIPGYVVLATVRLRMASATLLDIPAPVLDRIAAGDRHALDQLGLSVLSADSREELSRYALSGFEAGMSHALWVLIAMSLVGLLVAVAMRR